MNKVIHKKNIRYVKLCLISPAFELIISIVYIVSFLMLSYNYSTTGSNFANFEINQMTQEYLDEKTFQTIKTDADFIAYLASTLNKLYTFDPDVYVPVMIPLGGIKLIKYIGDPITCSKHINKTPCQNFQCMTSVLEELFTKSDCGQPYKAKPNYEINNNQSLNRINDPFEGLISNFNGLYSSYDLFSDGNQMDITIDEYTADPNKIVNFIKDPDLKFIVMIINMVVPSNDNYINIVAGIEMMTYFNPPIPLFSVSIYNNSDPNDAFFLSSFILFSCAVSLNIIKLIYEVNVKLIMSVHIFCLFNECLDILLLIFTCFYLSTANFKDINYLSKTQRSQFPLMAIRKYVVVIISMIMICIPFRLISLFSWVKFLSKPLVKYMGVIFRMLPGVFISILVIFFIIYMFTLMNYALYNQHFYQFSNIRNTFLSLFNYQIIIDLLDVNSGLYESITNSPYYVVINVFQLMVSFLLFLILIGTFSYLFKRASSLEEDKIENEVMLKLAQIEEKLTQGKDSIDNDLKKLKKQVLWMNLSQKNDLYNQYSTKNELLLFKASNQVISFLKYLFAIKPELQFKNLYNKFGILIEIRNERACLKESEHTQIRFLVDWLMFVGCKIPVVIYSQMNLEKTVKMKFHSIYRHITYITDQNDIYNFIKVTSKENVCCHTEKLSFIPPKNRRLSVSMAPNNVNISQQIYSNNNISLGYMNSNTVNNSVIGNPEKNLR